MLAHLHGDQQTTEAEHDQQENDEDNSVQASGECHVICPVPRISGCAGVPVGGRGSGPAHRWKPALYDPVLVRMCTFTFWKGGRIEAGNLHAPGTGDPDVAFDAIAFVPHSTKVTTACALDDSGI